MSIEGRIAAVLAKHDCYDYAGGLWCRCDESFYGDGDAHANQYWANHVAKVVVAELGLTEERAMHAVCPQEPVASSRYVTAWEPQ